MSLSGLAKFVIGFFVGILLLVGVGGATAFYFLTKLSAPPPKPVFAEELPKQKPVAKSFPKSKASYLASSTPTSVSSPILTTPSPQQQLEPGAYNARVKWRTGLSMRSEPSFDANKIGGVAYNQQVVVVKESDDKKWQQVRVASSNLVGWIKAGNLERVDTQ